MLIHVHTMTMIVNIMEVGLMIILMGNEKDVEIDQKKIFAIFDGKEEIEMKECVNCYVECIQNDKMMKVMQLVLIQSFEVDFEFS